MPPAGTSPISPDDTFPPHPALRATFPFRGRLLGGLLAGLPCSALQRGLRYTVPNIRDSQGMYPLSGVQGQRPWRSPYKEISFLPLTLKNTARAMMVEKVKMEEMAAAMPSLPRMIWE